MPRPSRTVTPGALATCLGRRRRRPRRLCSCMGICLRCPEVSSQRVSATATAAGPAPGRVPPRAAARGLAQSGPPPSQGCSDSPCPALTKGRSPAARASRPCCHNAIARAWAPPGPLHAFLGCPLPLRRAQARGVRATALLGPETPGRCPLPLSPVAAPRPCRHQAPRHCLGPAALGSAEPARPASSRSPFLRPEAPQPLRLPPFRPTRPPARRDNRCREGGGRVANGSADFASDSMGNPRP